MGKNLQFCLENPRFSKTLRVAGVKMLSKEPKYSLRGGRIKTLL